MMFGWFWALKSCTASSYTRLELDAYLVLIEFVQGFGFDFLKSVVPARVQVENFVDLGVLFSRAKQVNLFEILLPKHL